MPLTLEQFKKARASGFTTEQIAGFEKRRAGEQKKPTVEQNLQGMFGESKMGQVAERVTVDALIAPLTEVARGLHKGAASFYSKLDATAQLIEKIPGVGKRGGLFENISEQQERAAENIPDTEMHKIPETAYEIIGRIPSIVTEFALARSALSAAKIPQILQARQAGALTEPAEFALIGALDEYAKNPETASLAEGARKGAIIGMTFPIALRGMKFLWNFGKGTASRWIEFVTGNRKLAKEFVENPRQFNLTQAVDQKLI